MQNEPVQVESTNPASVFKQDTLHWGFPQISVGKPDPEPEPKKPSFDERLDIIITSGVIPHLPTASPSQVYNCDEDTPEENKRRDTEFLSGKKSTAPVKPIVQQEPLPVDQETLEQVKRMKMDEEEVLSQQKSEESVKTIILPPSPKHSDVEDPDSSSSSDVSDHSGIASDVEEKAQELNVNSSNSSSSSNDDDIQYLTSNKNHSDMDDEKSSSSNEDLSFQSIESGIPDDDDDDDDSQIGGEESSSSMDDDDLPLQRASDRKRKQTDRYNDNDFPDDDEKKPAVPPKPKEVQILKSDLISPSEKLLSYPASKRRNNTTTELPPTVNAISNIQKFKSRGKHLTKLYTQGWNDLMNYAIDTACYIEFKKDGRNVNKPLNSAQPLIVNFLCTHYMRHLFEETDPSQFVPNSDDAEILKCQRYFFVYRDCSMTSISNGWSKIELWDPYDWALERNYPEKAIIHVKTEHLSAYTALRIALYPHEYCIYRARIAVRKALNKEKEAPDITKFSTAVKKIESFKLGLCNDWCVTCQLADLDIFGPWKQFNEDSSNFTY
jgi:hypothetical protein